MAETYKKYLQGIPFITLPSEMPWAKSVYWMYAITLTPDAPLSKNDVRKRLLELGVDTRDFFYPMHTQPILKKYEKKKKQYPVSVSASERGFYLPSGLTISESQIRTSADALRTVLGV